MDRFSIYLIFLIFISCTNNNQEDYFTNFNCEWENTDFTLFLPTNDCELENISYNNQIATLIENKCIACHSQSGNNHGVNLSSYSSILNYDLCFQIDNNLMPPVGVEPLTECEKLQFKNWVDNGLVE